MSDQDPLTEQVPASGEVRLPAGSLGQTPDCTYTVEHDVMVIDGALRTDWCAGFVKALEGHPGWGQSTQVSGASAVYAGGGRTSASLRLAGLDEYEDQEQVLSAVIWGAARFYACWNRYVVLGRQDGWEVLRYQPGDVFNEHVDAIAGNNRWGSRQLSCLVYLAGGGAGGRTIFRNPAWRLEVKPEPGRIVLFPPGATHPHRGEAPAEGDKYVIVGWFYP